MLHQTPFFLPLLFPGLVWRVPTPDKLLFLTFDDGPVPGPTDAVLAILRDHAVSATFFCIGDNVRKHPDVFERVKADGHLVGNHTRNHRNGWKTNAAAYLENVAACDEDLGSVARVFRPPYGRITPAQVRQLASKKIIMWDVLSRDYNSALAPADCLRGTLGAIRPGSIIVFHDSLKAEKNLLYALPRFLEGASRQGFSFAPLIHHL